MMMHGQNLIVAQAKLYNNCTTLVDSCCLHGLNFTGSHYFNCTNCAAGGGCQNGGICVNVFENWVCDWVLRPQA